jgi:hypothetical protein
LAARDRLESRTLRLLKEDEEFRYAVAGLIGLDRHEEEIAKLREDILEESRTVRKEDGDQA